jgi:hypothetical protein
VSFIRFLTNVALLHFIVLFQYQVALYAIKDKTHYECSFRGGLDPQIGGIFLVSKQKIYTNKADLKIIAQTIGPVRFFPPRYMASPPLIMHTHQARKKLNIHHLLNSRIYILSNFPRTNILISKTDAYA